MSNRQPQRWKRGAAFVLTAGICILFYFLVARFEWFAGAIGKLLSIIRPFLFGGIIAYLLIPVSNYFEHTLARWLAVENMEKEKRKVYEKRLFHTGIVLSILAFFMVVILFFATILPQLGASIRDLLQAMPGYIETVSEVFESITVSEHFPAVLQGFAAQGQDLVRKTILPENAQMQTYLTAASSGLLAFLAAVKDLLIGVIIAIYIMFDRKKFSRQLKMVVLAIFPYRWDQDNYDEQFADWLFREASILNQYAGGFIKGKLLDSTIVGIICLIVTLLFQVPYAVLVSVIVAVTNIIPFFGPFIGGIPCAILILMVSPAKCLFFIIFITILQQVDGNIIGPRILGNAINLSSFWVLFAILFFGGLMGVPGMLFGVPLFGFIYQLVRERVYKKVNKQKEQFHHYVLEELELAPVDTQEDTSL